jgi:hypothetical protein
MNVNLKPGMKVLVEPPAGEYDVTGSDGSDHRVWVQQDGGPHSLVPASWCKPVLPEIGVGDFVLLCDQEYVVGFISDTKYVTVINPATGRVQSPQYIANLTLVRKASYTEVES